MEYAFQIKRSLPVLLLSLMLIIFSAVNSLAGEGEQIAWNTILPEEKNISLQQQRVIDSLEATLIELDSVIDKNIQAGKISGGTDFTANKDVSIVYDYLAYRIYELMKIDRKIKDEFIAQEKSFEKDNTSNEVTRRYYTMKADYEKKGENFFSRLDNFKRAVFVKDLKDEVENLKSSIGELRYAINLYSSFRISIASR